MVFRSSTQGNQGCRVKFRPIKMDFADLNPSVLAERAFLVFGDLETMKSHYASDIRERWKKLPVDFSKDYLVCIQQGLCPTGGYRISVKDIIVQPQKIRITVSFIQPHPDELVTLAMTMPYVFFAVPRLSFPQEPIVGFYSEDGEHFEDCKPLYGKVSKIKFHDS